MPSRVLRQLIFLTAFIAPLSAFAQTDTPTAIAASTPATFPLDHGWVAVRDNRAQATQFIHLPPRGVEDLSNSDAFAPLGWIRLASATPSPIAGVGVQLANVSHGVNVGSSYALFVLRDVPRPSSQSDVSSSTSTEHSDDADSNESSPGQMIPLGKRQRSVLGLRAVRAAGEVWDSPLGRPEVLPAIPGEPDLLGIVGIEPPALAPSQQTSSAGKSASGPATAISKPLPIAAVLLRSREHASLIADSASSLTNTSTNRPYQLLALYRSRWIPMTLPWESGKTNLSADVSASSAPLTPWPMSNFTTLLNWSQGLAILTFAPGENVGQLWIASIGQDLPSESSAPSLPTLAVSWTHLRVPLPSSFSVPTDTSSEASATNSRHEPDLILTVHDAGGSWRANSAELSPANHIIALTWERKAEGISSRVRMIALRESGWIDLGVLEDIPHEAQVTSVGRQGNNSGLAFVWLTDTTKSTSTSPGSASGSPSGQSGLMIREVGLYGQPLFAGPARTGGGRFQRELQTVAIFLLMVMVTIVLFVIRTDTRAPIKLPEGVVVAAPTRRIVAGTIDYALAAVLSSVILSIPISTIILPVPVFSSSDQLSGLLLALLIAWLHTTMGEWLLGASIGKRLTGIWIMSIPPSPTPERATTSKSDLDSPQTATATPTQPLEARAGASLVGCAVRNLVRWGLPITGLILLVDPQRRHPGDHAARTIVVEMDSRSDIEDQD